MLLMVSLWQGTLHAEEPADSYTEPGFQGIDVVTQDTYQPLDRNVAAKLENKAMGSSQPSMDMYRSARASAPYWKNDDGAKSFYDAQGTLMYRHGSKMVIDVSEHNGNINWEKVKAAGIDGAIIRVGYGYLGEDKYFQRNVRECNRLGIPYGIYLYSYAYDKNFAYGEAEGTAEMLKKVSLNLSYPIYYDIEAFDSWNDNGTTREHPNTVQEYEGIIATYIERMSALGYGGKVHVYSYRSYLQNQLNSPRILPYVSWIAAYTQTLGFDNTYYNGEEGWQYTSSGKVDGISGRVDLNCFSNQFYNTALSTSIPSNMQAALQKSGAKFSNGYLSGMKLGTDLTSLANNLSSVGAVTCFNKNGGIVNGGRIATGQKITVTTNTNGTTATYTVVVVVRGDVNGDGKISALDYVKVRNKLDGKKSLLYYEAQGADVNSDGKISALDYVKIRNQLDGKSTIVQK